jgi:hypothetical protein
MTLEALLKIYLPFRADTQNVHKISKFWRNNFVGIRSFITALFVHIIVFPAVHVIQCTITSPSYAEWGVIVHIDDLYIFLILHTIICMVAHRKLNSELKYEVSRQILR